METAGKDRLYAVLRYLQKAHQQLTSAQSEIRRNEHYIEALKNLNETMRELSALMGEID